MSRDGAVYRKFIVERTDGSSAPGMKHHECDYFVLDLRHDPFSLPAIAAYAKACEDTHPALADDLRERYLPELKRRSWDKKLETLKK